jgi:hypothetical protein
MSGLVVIPYTPYVFSRERNRPLFWQLSGALRIQAAATSSPANARIVLRGTPTNSVKCRSARSLRSRFLERPAGEATMRLPLFLLLAIGSVLPASASPAESQPPGLKITTRFTSGRARPSITTQFVKGARSRVERDILGHPRVTINQCDRHQVVQLDPEARQYTSYQLNEQGRPAGSEAAPPTRTPIQTEPSGGTLVVSIETTDTGERKKLFGYTARHVITTQTMIPGPGAVTQGQEIVRDGWYIDLDVNAGCAPRPNGAAFAFLSGSSRPAGSAPKADKIEVHRKGAPENGFALSITTKQTSRSPSGETFTSESLTEVVELSSAPLDPALFEVPEGVQKVDRLPDYIAASAKPSPPQGTWDTIKRYWTSLLR